VLSAQQIALRDELADRGACERHEQQSQRPVKIPASVPMAAPITASLLAPAFFAPKAAAIRSTAHAMAVRMPRMTSNHTGMRVKSSIHAASTMPPKTRTAPGSKGSVSPVTLLEEATRRSDNPEKDAHAGIGSVDGSARLTPATPSTTVLYT
jgi:hypothetical protein